MVFNITYMKCTTCNYLNVLLVLRCDNVFDHLMIKYTFVDTILVLINMVSISIVIMFIVTIT